jgi:hypothetical protein
LSGLRIQSLTKAPRTPALQDFKGVKKSGRFTRITSFCENFLLLIIKKNLPGSNRFFPTAFTAIYRFPISRTLQYNPGKISILHPGGQDG